MPEALTRCLSCLGPVKAQEAMHEPCLRRLFGRSTMPEILVDPATLHLFGQKMAGRVSLSGVQRKLSLGWHKLTLTVTAEHSSYILKIDGDDYPELAANEHISLHLAKRFGLSVPELALVRLSDGQFALIVKRFDRQAAGRRVPMEDFCQLNELHAADKYSGSAELCVRTIRRFADEPGPNLLRLFRCFLFSWWIGNGDLHLKNLALLSAEPGRPRLAPAYDILCTRALIAGDPLALPVQGRVSKLTRSTWLSFADYCGVPARLAEKEMAKLTSLLPEALDLVRASFLSQPILRAVDGVLTERTSVLDSG